MTAVINTTLSQQTSFPLTLIMNTDNDGHETSWGVKDCSNAIVWSGGGGTAYIPNATYTHTKTLPPGQYWLTVYDEGGNGFNPNGSECGSPEYNSCESNCYNTIGSDIANFLDLMDCYYNCGLAHDGSWSSKF